MIVNGTRFGDIDIEEAEIIAFPTGIIGFPEARRFILLRGASGGTIGWLQSIDVPRLALPVIDGVQLSADYPASPVLAAAESLGVSAKDPAVLVTVVVRGGAISANLLAPIVVDLASRSGAQIVLDPRRYQSSVPIGVARSTPPGPMPVAAPRLEAAAPLPAREPTPCPRTSTTT